MLFHDGSSLFHIFFFNHFNGHSMGAHPKASSHHSPLGAWSAVVSHGLCPGPCSGSFGEGQGEERGGADFMDANLTGQMAERVEKELVI